jgi:hypothetical protein
MLDMEARGMTEIERRSLLGVGLTLGSAVAATLAAPSLAGARQGTAVDSVSAMTTMPDGRLVLADWRAGRLVAVELPPAARAAEGAFNVTDLDAALADAGATLPLRASAMAWHAPSRRAVIALTLGRAPDAPVRLALLGRDGRVALLDPATAVTGVHDLADPPGEGVAWERFPLRSLTVTDLQARPGEVMVAGLSNTSFASTLRRVPYPFGGRASVTRIEMYHAVHNQIETRAPVRAMAVVELEGAPYLLAAYTCTPLVTVPLDALRDGTTVRGKTIAELGYGNTPIGVLPFAFTYRGESSAWVLVANSARSADLIALPAIAEAQRGPGLSTPVRAPFTTHAGLSTIGVPITGLVRLVDQDANFLLALRRDAASGMLQLVSFRKGAFFRLSDHINEYDFPGYDYPPEDSFQQEYIRPFQRMLRAEEGFPGLAR